MDSLTIMEKQLKAVSDANRLKLLACLKQGEVCVCDLVDVLKVSQPAVSQQLRKLKEAGIILERKKGLGSIIDYMKNNLHTSKQLLKN